MMLKKMLKNSQYTCTRTVFTNNPKSSKGHFLGQIQHCWKLVLSHSPNGAKVALPLQDEK